MSNVKWIKFQTNTFEGLSFKKIRKAQIEGITDMRDKLTAIWFELLALAGRINNNGSLASDEMPYENIEDLAIILDRTKKEMEICLSWFENNKMIVVIDNCYKIANWGKFQDEDKLKKLEMNRNRVQKHRDKKNEDKALLDSVMHYSNAVMKCNAHREEKEKDKELEKDNTTTILTNLSNVISSSLILNTLKNRKYLNNIELENKGLLLKFLKMETDLIEKSELTDDEIVEITNKTIDKINESKVSFEDINYKFSYFETLSASYIRLKLQEKGE